MILFVAAGVFAATGARADGDAVGRADKLFKDGRRAAEHGDYAHACKLFEESFRLDPGVGTLINLGDCAEHLGDMERAWNYYRTAYARMPENDDRAPRVHERVENIEQHAAKVAIHLDEGAPDGTVVTVDGAVVGSLGAPLHLAKGAHVVLVTAVGYRGKRYDVVVRDGEIRVLRVTPGTALEAEVPTELTQHPARAPSPRATSWTRPVGVASMGLGLAGIWVGSLAGLMAIDRRDVQRTQCDATDACTSAGLDAAHDGATWATVSTAAFIAGGALLALGGALVVVSLAGHARPNVTLGVGPRGLVFGGTFE